MKQVLVKKGHVIVEDVPVPICGDNEVLVANAYSLISAGTELSTIKRFSLPNLLMDSALIKKALVYAKERGTKEAMSTAKEFRDALMPLGYSSAGIVIAIGKNISNIDVGDKVACAGAGKANHAEVVAVPRNLVTKIPDGVSFEEATFTTLGAIAMHGIRRAGRQFGETIIILGVGLIGQLAVQIAKAAGYKVIAVDKDPHRVELSKRAGADIGLVVGKDDLEKEVLYRTDGVGADAVVIYAATASSEPVNQSMKLVRKKGRIVVVGDVGLNIDRAPFYEKELDLLISRSYGPGRYDPLYEEKGIDYPIDYVRWTENRNMRAFLELLREKKIDISPLIEAAHIFPIEEAEKAYKVLGSGREKPLSILLKYAPSKYYTPKGEVKLQRFFPISPRIVAGKINVAVVGAGNFARNVLLPLLSRIPEYNLRAIATATAANAKQVASKYKAEYCTTDYREVLKDDNTDLVMITTRHNLHFPMIIGAAKAGKAIYVEKPMCLTEEELNEIIKVISKTKIPLIVGFNRRYAPLAVKANRLLKRKHGPYLINYRVNAGFVPKTHWVQDPEVGGRRIVGECCHFFDLFNYFVGAEIKSMGVESIPVNDTTVAAQDNIVATLRWTDGSLTTLIYTTLGHPDLPKERIEIFANGGSLTIDDFVELRGYGFKEKSIKLKKQDKGHHNQLVELAKFLKEGKSSIIPFEESVKAMKITFDVEKRIKKCT
ncbi:Inositol 2-dehydrogenase/D-chiro-inositol 3-dehydrogenase [subsurface metagenome]|nr:zinc-binding dehydrogenase [Hadesarchaea archaeon]